MLSFAICLVRRRSPTRFPPNHYRGHYTIVVVNALIYMKVTRVTEQWSSTGFNFTPDIIETPAVHFEYTSTRPTTAARVYPTGALVVTLLAVISSSLNFLTEPEL